MMSALMESEADKLVGSLPFFLTTNWEKKTKKKRGRVSSSEEPVGDYTSTSTVVNGDVKTVLTDYNPKYKLLFMI